MIKRLTTLIVLTCFYSTQIFSQCTTHTLTGNQVIGSNTTWTAGTYNISGDFTINAGVTLTVSYSGNCPLTINANNITIIGAINADGAGATGGTGGTGGSSDGGAGGGNQPQGGDGGGAGSGLGGGTAGGNGSAASSGCSISCGTVCVDGHDALRAGAGGGAGGSGGSFGAGGGAGGAGAQGRFENPVTNSDCGSTPSPGSGGTANNSPAAYSNTAVTYDLPNGSGGGGGGGGGGGFSAGTNGGAGGNGGGAVNLDASGNLIIVGSITANGTNGAAGGDGGIRSGNGASWNCTNVGGSESCGGGANAGRDASSCGACCYYTWSWPGGAGGGAGGGSGGAIKLQATGAMTVTGSLQANGGNGGSAGHGNTTDGSCNNYAAGGGAGAGGVIKYVYDPCANNTFSPSQVQVAAGTPGLGTDGNVSADSGHAGVVLNQQFDIYVPGFTPFTTLTAFPNQVLCGIGLTPNGLSTFAVTGGDGAGYQYQWYYSVTNPVGQTGGSATPAAGWLPVSGGTASSLPAVTIGPVNSTTYYQLQIISGPCATWSNAVTILVDSIPKVSSVTVGNVLCNGGNTGSITVNATGGDPGYTYSSDSGLLYFSGTLTGLSQGTYNVFVKDTNNCFSAYASNPVTVNQPQVLTFTDVVTNANCVGLSNGEIVINPAGGVTPYQYAINAGANQNSNSFTGLAQGSYLILVTDANGCPDTSSIAVNNAYVFTLSIDTQSNASCFGDSNATVTLATSGGIYPSTYSLFGSTDTSGYFTGLPQGYYIAMATDSAGCASQVNVHVNQAPQIVVQVDALVNIPCNNSAKGQVFVSPVGGNPAYSYLWSTGDTTAGDTGLVIGTYTVTITDAHTCSASASINVNYDAAPSVTVTSTDVTGCFGNTNGSASVTATGGTAPLLYQWSNGSTATSITNLSGGTYIITVSDLNYCGAVDSIVINQPAAIAANLDTLAPTCFGLSNGMAGVSPTGGTPGLTVAWSTTSAADTLMNIAAGNYSVTITDANNCSVSLSFSLSQPTALSTSLVSVNDSCYGSPNGSAAFTGTGGTLPYSYAWSNSSTANSIDNLAAGTYTVTLTDANQCISTDSAIITQPAQLFSSTTSANATGGQDNGSASVNNITGGVSPYMVKWSNGQLANTISNLAGGTYIAFITDANGCQISDTVVVNSILGIDMVEGDIAFSIYPNPAKTSFTVEMTALNKETTLSMKDVLGQTIFTKLVVTPKTVIDLTNFAEGVYLIELSQGDSKTIKQVVVTK